MTLLYDSRTGLTVSTDLVGSALDLYLRENPDVSRVGIGTTQDKNHYILLNKDNVQFQDPKTSRLVYNPGLNRLGIGSFDPKSTIDLGPTGSISASLFGGTAGSIVYQSSPNVTSFFTNGLSGQILRSNGSSSQPFSWVTPDTNSLEADKLRTLSVSNDPTVYVGVGSTVNDKLVISGISTAKFFVGEYVKVLGVTSFTDNILVDPPSVVSAVATKVGSSNTVSTYRYWIAQYHMRNGKVGVSSQISPTAGIGMTSIDNFNDLNHISLNFSRSDTNHGILIYRQIGVSTNINDAKLIAILGPKELTNATSNINWIDYGTYDQTEWSPKGTVNEYTNDIQFHFPNIATTGQRRGWIIDNIVSVGNSSITLEGKYKTNLGIGTDQVVKVVHDNTYSLKQAIEFSVTNGGRYLSLPSGTYYVNKLSIPTNFTVGGNGKNTIIKKQFFANDSDDGVGNLLSFNGTVVGLGTTNASYVTLKDITIDGNFSNNILFESDTDNYLVNFDNISSSLIKDFEIRNSSSGGITISNSTRLSIENSSFVDGCLSDRYPFQPLTADGSDVLRINDCLFENFSGPVDISVTSVVSANGNIIRNCGTGIRAYATGKIITSNNIILGPSDEFIPTLDIYDSDYNSINFTIQKGLTFTGPVLQYVEDGEAKDISSNKVSIISAGIATILNVGLSSETLGQRFLDFNIITQDSGTFGREHGYIQLGLTSTQTNTLGFSSILGYEIIAKEYLTKPIGFATYVGIATGTWNTIGAGATQYTITLSDYQQFPGISTGDVVKLVDHSVSPDLSAYELTVAEKINVNSITKRLRLTGLTTTSVTNGNLSGYISIRNVFLIARGRVGVI